MYIWWNLTEFIISIKTSTMLLLILSYKYYMYLASQPNLLQQLR